MKLFKLTLILMSISLLSGCNSENDVNYCADISPTKISKNAFLFDYFEQDIVTNRAGRKVAVSCHNCYANNSELNETLTLIHSAKTGSADFIEIDVLYGNENINSIAISHDESSELVDFDAVINSPDLVDARQILFVEVKGVIISEEQARTLIRQISAPMNAFNQRAYLNPNRMTFIRSFEFDGSLSRFYQVLEEPEFAEVRPYILLSRLTYIKSQKTMFAEIEQAAECGLDMVELSAEVKTQRLTSLSEYAQSLGLLVNVFTFNDDELDTKLSQSLSHVDVVTIEPNRNAETQTVFESAKEIIQQSNL
ncbi:hypothetical protein [Thalassotalea atypica]|uniref:hypothetical protein n=1 Tax=Thalassotalea atypica TaxID=2054316 RepID=UPI0025733388|nr:hypothetical protein [Thalassotalea atypica]